jgi:hypothetical protein
VNLYDHMSAEQRAQEYARIVADRVTGMQSDLHSGKWLAAMGELAQANAHLSSIAAELVELAIREGASQAACARALNVPPSTLRGAKREFSRDEYHSEMQRLRAQREALTDG